jgi:U3 small nucleolar RNA-associated protein 18
VGIAEQEAEASDSVASEPAEQPASSSEDEGEAKTAPPTQPTRTRAAWADPDDTTLNVSLAASNRLRKLRDAPSEDIVGGREYERRLRRQYEKINPTPDWAVTARKKTRPKRPRSSSGSEGSDESDHGDSVQELFKSTNGITRVHKKGTLPQGTLAIERLRDANQAAASEGEVKVVRFHPSPQVPVLLTAGADRRARLFNVRWHFIFSILHIGNSRLSSPLQTAL